MRKPRSLSGVRVEAPKGPKGKWKGTLTFMKSKSALDGFLLQECEGTNPSELLRQMADEIEWSLPRPRRLKPFVITLEQFRSAPATWMKKRTAHRSVVVHDADGKSVMTIC